jgi:hypothetical protein
MKKESPKNGTNVVEELAVNISTYWPAQSGFNFLQRPSVERVGIIMHWPGVSSLEEGSIIC